MLRVLDIWLLYFIEGPKLLRLHYPIYHGLYRERFVVDALVERSAEPEAAAKTALTIAFDRPELANLEVCIIHKLLVARPNWSLILFSTFHWSLLLEIKLVDLSHRGEVDEVCGIDHYPRMLLFLPALKPLVESVINDSRFVVLVKFPIRFCFRSPNLAWRTGVPEPPEAFKREVLTDIGQWGGIMGLGLLGLRKIFQQGIYCG